MKINKILFGIILVTISNVAFGQTFIMTNGQTVNTCTGTFYDDGGPSNDYSLDTVITYTICADQPNYNASVFFNMFDTEGSFDELNIYDGPTTTSPLIGSYSGGALQGQRVTAQFGCLTFEFDSDFIINDPGWEATISCVAPCQAIDPELISSTPALNGNGEILICSGDSVTLTGGALFPDNNTYYGQSANSSQFVWAFGDGSRDTAQTVTYAFADGGFQLIDLTVIDSNGCRKTERMGIAKVSPVPDFSASTISKDSVCLDEQFQIIARPQTYPNVVSFDISAGATYLPDGSGVSYTSTLPINVFTPGQTVSSISDLDGICINLEHSYLGDLEIEIVCPNGQSAVLKSYPGGGGTFLGEPIDNTTSGPGIGYDYCFTPSPTYSTMLNESGNHQYTYTDRIGNTYTNKDYLPGGSYQSEDPLSNLVGCPLNGDWDIIITDNLGADDGYIFDWGIDFSPNILPASFFFQTDIVDSAWVGTGSMSPVLDTMLTDTGMHSFVYEVTDDFGCTYDTTFEVYVRPRIIVDAGLDDSTCLLTVDLNAIKTPGASSQWSIYSPDGNTATFSDPSSQTSNTVGSDYGVYSYIWSESKYGCAPEMDTITVQYIQLNNPMGLSVDIDTGCLDLSVVFTNNSDVSGIDRVMWNFGDGDTSSNSITGASHTYTSEGNFDVSLQLYTVEGCMVDTTIISMVNVYSYPIADFDFTPQVPIVPETTVDFQNFSINNYLNYWYFSDLDSSQLVDPIYQFPVDQGATYPVTLIVENLVGCKDTITYNVVIKDDVSVFLPNAFTPDGDGQNELIRPTFTSVVKDYEWTIFDKWGNIVFKTTDLQKSWDGKVNNQSVPSNSVFVSKIEYKKNDEIEIQKLYGTITLVR